MTEFKYCVYCEDEPAICFNTEAEAMKFAREDTSMYKEVRVEKTEVNEGGDILNSEVIWSASNVLSDGTIKDEKDNPFETEFPKSDIEDISEIDDEEYEKMYQDYLDRQDVPADWDDPNRFPPKTEDLNIKEAVKNLEEHEDEVECKVCFELGPKAEMKKLDIGYVCPKCAQELHSHQGTNLDLIDKDPFSLDYEDPRDFDEPEEEEVKEEPVDENEVRKFEAGIEEKLEEHINDRPADIESDQVLHGADNAVVDCKAAKVIAHSEDEKPLDCKMEKPALEEPLAGEKVDTKLNEELKVIIDFSEYKPWSGAVDTYELIKDADKLDELESYLEECYPDGVTAGTINDILWFDSDEILKYLGLGDVEDEEVDEALNENIFGAIGRSLKKLGKNIANTASKIWNFTEKDKQLDEYVKNVLHAKYNLSARNKSKGEDFSKQPQEFESLHDAESKAKELSNDSIDTKIAITDIEGNEVILIVYRNKKVLKDNIDKFLDAIKLAVKTEDETNKKEAEQNVASAEQHSDDNSAEGQKSTEESRPEENTTGETQKRDMSKQNKARADYKKLTQALKILNVDPKVLRTEDGKVTPEFKELRKILFAESLGEELTNEELENLDLEEAKKDDDLPVDPEAAKLEVHTMLNDLVADEIEAINGYEEAKKEILDTPIAHKDNILDTIDHVEDEEKEHVDELISATTEIPFDKEEVPAPVVEKPLEQDFPEVEEDLEESAPDTPFDSDIKEGDKIRIIHLEGEDNSYDGKEGEVTNIDSIGQLHGTWGGLAVIPGVDDFDIITEDLTEAKAKPEGDKVQSYNNGLKLAKLHNKPVIYGYTNSSYGNKFFELDDPIICDNVSDETKKFRQQYKSCNVVYVAYPSGQLIECLLEELPEGTTEVDYVEYKHSYCHALEPKLEELKKIEDTEELKKAILDIINNDPQVNWTKKEKKFAATVRHKKWKSVEDLKAYLDNSIAKAREIKVSVDADGELVKKLTEEIEFDENGDEIFTPEEQEEFDCDEWGYSNKGYDQFHHCGWCEEIYPESEMRHEADFGWICSRCEDELKSHGGPLTFIED